MIEKQLKLGKAFKELRNLAKMTGADLKSVLSRESLIKFEGDKNILGLQKLNAALSLIGFTLTDLFYMAGYYNVDPRYGSIFHTVRWQRGYRRDFFVLIGVSPTRLSLFEDGRIMFSYSTIDAMLKSMKVPESDFEYALFNEENFFIDTIDKLDIAIQTKNVDYIRSVESIAHRYTQLEEKTSEHQVEEKSLYECTDEELEYYAQEQLTRQYADYKVLELTAKAGYKQLSEEEQIELDDFLIGIDIWMEFSLGILAINSWRLPYLMIHGILCDIVRDKKKYLDKLVYRRRIVQAGERSAMFQTVEGNLDNAKDLLEMVKEFVFSVDIHTQGMYRFAQAFLKWKQGVPEAQTEMLKVIASFEFLGENISSNFAREYYERYVVNKK